MAERKGDTTEGLGNWGSSRPIEQWEGVTVDADGRVKLRLPRKGLTCKVPSAQTQYSRFPPFAAIPDNIDAIDVVFDVESRYSLVVSLALLREGRATVPNSLECVRQAALFPSRPRRLLVELLLSPYNALKELNLFNNQISGKAVRPDRSGAIRFPPRPQ